MIFEIYESYTPSCVFQRKSVVISPVFLQKYLSYAVYSKEVSLCPKFPAEYHSQPVFPKSITHKPSSYAMCFSGIFTTSREISLILYFRQNITHKLHIPQEYFLWETCFIRISLIRLILRRNALYFRQNMTHTSRILTMYHSALCFPQNIIRRSVIQINIIHRFLVLGQYLLRPVSITISLYATCVVGISSYATTSPVISLILRFRQNITHKPHIPQEYFL